MCVIVYVYPNSGGIMRRLLLFLIISAILTAFAFSQTAGSKMWVAVQNATVRATAKTTGREMGKLPHTTEVTVTRADGKWIEIRAGNITGWVASAELSPRRVIASNASVKPEEVALAGKGFSPAVEEEYRRSGLDYSMVNAMERITVSATDLQQFITEGRLAGEE